MYRVHAPLPELFGHGSFATINRGWRTRSPTSTHPNQRIQVRAATPCRPEVPVSVHDIDYREVNLAITTGAVTPSDARGALGAGHKTLELASKELKSVVNGTARLTRPRYEMIGFTVMIHDRITRLKASRVEPGGEEDDKRARCRRSALLHWYSSSGAVLRRVHSRGEYTRSTANPDFDRLKRAHIQVVSAGASRTHYKGSLPGLQQCWMSDSGEMRRVVQ